MNLNKMLAFLSQEDLQELTEKILSTEDKTFQNITFHKCFLFWMNLILMHDSRRASFGTRDYRILFCPLFLIQF